MVNAQQFIDKMEGFMKKGSKVQKVDPLKLKEIWEPKRNTTGKTFPRRVKPK